MTSDVLKIVLEEKNETLQNLLYENYHCLNWNSEGKKREGRGGRGIERTEVEKCEPAK